MKSTCNIEFPITKSCATYKNYFNGILLMKLIVIQVQLFDVIMKSMRTETMFFSTGVTIPPCSSCFHVKELPLNKDPGVYKGPLTPTPERQ